MNSSRRCRGRQVFLIAVLGDRHALDQFHDEIRPAAVGRAGVEHLGDVGVVHQGQGLPFGLEAGDDLAAVHARLDDLQSDPALDRARSARPCRPRPCRLRRVVARACRGRSSAPGPSAIGGSSAGWSTVLEKAGGWGARKLPASPCALSNSTRRRFRSWSSPQAWSIYSSHSAGGSLIAARKISRAFDDSAFIKNYLISISGIQCAVSPRFVRRASDFFHESD